MPVKKRIIQFVAVTTVSTMMSSAAFASAFQSFEQNVSGLGQADAGAASIANDATTEFENPAGMTHLKKAELDVSGVMVSATAHFKAKKAENIYDEPIKGKMKSDPLGTEVLPGIHFVTPIINDRTRFGFGITVPYGFETQYPSDSVVRYITTKSKLATLNINPSLAYKLNKHWSIGLGVDLQGMEADLNQAIDSRAILHPYTSTNLDTIVKNKATNWGWGVNGGLLYEVNDNTRFGLSYRSQVFHHLNGTMRVHYNSHLTPEDVNMLKLLGIYNNRVYSKITMPEMLIFSGYHAFNAKWAVMGSITYTGWDSFRKMTLHFKNNNPTGGEKTPDATTIEHFRDTYKYALGVNYSPTQKTTWRAGIAADMTPVQKAFRTARLPDGNRIWLTLGAHHRFTKHLSMDVGYARIFIRNTNVDETVYPDPTQKLLGNHVEGSYKHNYADLVGVQVNWIF